MNILLVTNVTDETLFKTSRFELANALRTRGHEVTLIMAKGIGEKKSTKKNIIYIPTISHQILSGLLLSTILFFYFPFIIMKKKVDIVMAAGVSIWFPFALVTKQFNIPVIMDIRGLQTDKEKSILFDVFLNLGKYILVGFTTITPELKDILKQRYNIKDKKIGCWSSGVSMNNFNPMQVIDSHIDISRYKSSFMLMYHGSYSPTRSIENLIESLAELNNELRKKIKLLIVGIDCENSKRLSLLCEKIGIEDMVIFQPKVRYDLIASYISSCDVGVIPLSPKNKWWRVSSPLKTLEYLAMGKPIIATNIPFHQRIFKMAKCGVLLNDNDPKSLSGAIAFLYNNREKLDEMGNNGKDLVQKHYTWDHKALEVEKFIKSLMRE